MILYERIRELRIKAGMTQDELAKAMGYKDRSMITKIESGKVDISQKKIVAFAEVLKTTPGYLMGWLESEDQQRSLPVQDSKELVKLITAMTPEDYTMVLAAIDRTYKRLKAEGKM